MYIFRIFAIAVVMATLAACAGMPPMSAYGHDGRSAYGVAVGGYGNGYRRPPPGYYNQGYRRPPPPRVRIGATIDIGVRPSRGYHHPRPAYLPPDGRCRRESDGRWYRLVPRNGRPHMEECPPPPRMMY